MPDSGDSMSENIIEVENVTRRFRNTLAVNALSLAVKRGEILGLVGPDGAGKTTTLRLLAAIMDPTSGRVRVAGYDTVKEPEEVKKRIGYMPQQFSLYGDLSVKENLNFFADIFGMGVEERKRRIARLLTFSRLTEFQDRPAGKLSGGMQKKLALACCLLHQPELLLLDEPTTGVDSISRREFWDILTELHLSGVTLVVTTPYMDEAERCSRVALMFQGRLIACDEPEVIRQQVAGDLIEVRTANLGRVREAIRGLKGVLEIQTYGDLLHVIVTNGTEGIQLITRELAERGIAAQDIRQAKPRLEDSFVSLIQKQIAEGPGGEVIGE